MRIGVGTWAIGITLAAHGALAFSIVELESPPPPREPTVITIRDTKPRPPKPRPPEPPPPTPPLTAPAVAPPRAATPPPPRPARRAPTPPAASTSATSSSAPHDFNVRLGGDGASVPAAVPAGGETAPPPPPRPKLLETPAALAPTEACSEPAVKPRPIKVVQPAFTQDAQDAGIDGKVRVEIAISETGAITSVRVIEGLGHGLDEAAVEAARASEFSPATKCGSPIATTFVIGMRFRK